MFVVVSYDIADNGRRRKVFKMMKNYGHRVQRSVFECLLPAEKVQEMKKRIRSLMDRREDDVRYYTLCEACRHQATVQGIGKILKEQPVIFA